MMLSTRLSDALSFAIQAHAGQCRKGGKIPYVSHLLAVAGLVLEFGGDEDQAIAGLLHDVLEDCGEQMSEPILIQFGPAVLAMVEACSDSLPGMDRGVASWRQRKVAYLAALPEKSKDSLLVTTCDKLHNARSLLQDVYEIGLPVFDRFNASRQETLWYQSAVADQLCQSYPHPVSWALRRVVDELHEAVQLASV